MSSDQNESTTDKILEDLTVYVDMKIADIKLSVVENMSVVFASALRILVAVVMSIVALILFAVALVQWLGVLLGSPLWGILIVGGTCLIIGVATYFMRRLFVNRMVKLFSKMFFTTRKNYSGYEE